MRVCNKCGVERDDSLFVGTIPTCAMCILEYLESRWRESDLPKALIEHYRSDFKKQFGIT